MTKPQDNLLFLSSWDYDIRTVRKVIALNKEFYQKDYDAIIYPEAVWGCHYKAAITKRNRWLADEAGYIIAYVSRDFGGAATALRYARKLKRNIINIATDMA